MNECPDHDLILTIQRATDGRLIELVGHLSKCSECRLAATEVERLRAELTETLEPRSGFTEEVLGSLAPEHDEPLARNTSRPSPVGLLNVGLAGLTATIAIAISAAGSQVGLSAAAVIAGGVVAAACYGLAEVLGS